MSNTNDSKSNIIDGRALAKKIDERTAKKAEKLKSEGVFPKLVTVLVGDDPASKMYVNMKHKACERIGIFSEDKILPESTTEDELIQLIRELNSDKEVSGILVQLPVPKHISSQKIMNEIAPEKDPDGFHPVNMGKLMIGDEGLVPCTPKGVIYMLDEYGINPEGKKAVVVGHSNIVGKPMTAMLLNRNATVETCHIFTKDLKAETITADILIVGVGVKHLITKDMVKEDAVVIDIGINKDETGTHGDVDFENVSKIAKLITPVPGGVGPMTIAVLMEHVVLCAEMQMQK
ncbi:MAG: bifunctional methylenetetrahydrofolate dehydrogenase/methenyltetrahydrofolate cyclohydrolase [Methanosarcinaceae archaeon]|nr:bifunctional methylenetetrahydrofolate dehydrogenase/methenyltetrahydrofolate cyclohydrolase [Methanosarcinaceae archaeon]